MTNKIPDKNDIKKLIEDHRYNLGMFKDWDKNLWKKTYEEIVEYLTKRFERTNDEIEYYCCLIYLEKHLPERLRYLPFSKTDQYKRLVGIPVDSNKVRKVQSKVKKFSTFSLVR